MQGIEWDASLCKTPYFEIRYIFWNELISNFSGNHSRNNKEVHPIYYILALMLSLRDVWDQPISCVFSDRYSYVKMRTASLVWRELVTTSSRRLKARAWCGHLCWEEPISLSQRCSMHIISIQHVWFVSSIPVHIWSWPSFQDEMWQWKKLAKHIVSLIE